MPIFKDSLLISAALCFNKPQSLGKLQYWVWIPGQNRFKNLNEVKDYLVFKLSICLYRTDVA